MEDIQRLIDSLLDELKSIDIAESEFRRLIYEDAGLRAAYAEWCVANDCSERHGFNEYCHRKLASDSERWEDIDYVSGDFE